MRAPAHSRLRGWARACFFFGARLVLYFRLSPICPLMFYRRSPGSNGWMSNTKSYSILFSASYFISFPVIIIIIIIEDACGESPPHRRAHEQNIHRGRVRAGGPARAAACPLSFAEALLNEVEPGFYTPMRRWRGGLQALRGTRRPCICHTSLYSVFHLLYEKCSRQA